MDGRNMIFTSIRFFYNLFVFFLTITSAHIYIYTIQELRSGAGRGGGGGGVSCIWTGGLETPKISEGPPGAEISLTPKYTSNTTIWG